jgi:hypothetical protein
MFVLSCDTKSTVEPRQEKTFIKIYGSETGNEAVDLIYDAPEQEMIILAKAYETGFEGSRDIMILKTDASGNNSNYFFTNTTGTDEDPMEMALLGSDVYIAGTIETNGERDMMLARFSLATNTFLWVNAYGEPGKDESAFSLDIQSGQIVLAGSAEDSIDIDDDQNLDVIGTVKNVRIIDPEGIEILESPRKNPGYVKDIQRFNSNVYHSLSQEIDPVTGEVNVQIDVGLFDGNFGTGYAPQIEGNDYPVNLIRLNTKILALGYKEIAGDPQRSSGMFLLVSSYDQTNGNLFASSSQTVEEGFEELEIVPAKMVQVHPDQFLILGTDNNDMIRLIKFIDQGNEFQIAWNNVYGTFPREDNAASVLTNQNNEYYFNATVYFQSDEFKKIALFKTNVNGHLNP